MTGVHGSRLSARDRGLRAFLLGALSMSLWALVSVWEAADAQETLAASTTGNASGGVSTIQSLLSSEGKILYGAEPNSIMVIDHPQNLQQIEQYLNMVDVKAEQVQIDARVVEVTLNDETALGINWNWRRDTLVGGLRVVSPIRQQIPFIGTTDFKSETTTPGTFNLTVFNDAIDVVLRAMAQHVKTDLLSAPRITTVNGRTASIEVVQQVPYVEVTVQLAQSAGQNDITTYALKREKVGITLRVTPTISPDGSISMRLEPEIGEVTGQFHVPVVTRQGPPTSYDVPIIDTRKASTNVIINNGQTLIIGGLIKDKLVEQDNKVPVLGDLPVVKPLFRSSLTTKKKTELLFFVSPTVITPDALAPMAREERYGLGKRYAEERQKRESSIFEAMEKEQQKLLERRVRESFETGRQLYQQGEYARALFQFQQVLQIQPGHKDAQQFIALIQQKPRETPPQAVEPPSPATQKPQPQVRLEAMDRSLDKREQTPPTVDTPSGGVKKRQTDARPRQP